MSCLLVEMNDQVRGNHSRHVTSSKIIVKCLPFYMTGCVNRRNGEGDLWLVTGSSYLHYTNHTIANLPEFHLD